MNALMSTTAALTMSSYEIAELLNTRHDSVKRSIERCVTRGAITPPPLVEVSNTGPGPLLLEVYQLSKRDSLVVVAQLSPEFTAAVVDRWQELEAAQAHAVPQTKAQALRLAAEQAELIEQQQAQLEAAQTKVEYVNRYVAAQGAIGFRQLAKTIGVNEHELSAWLQDKKIMYRLAGKLTPYQCHIDAGRFTVKTGVNQLTAKAFVQARFTPKGVEWVAGEWAKHLVAQKVGVA